MLPRASFRSQATALPARTLLLNAPRERVTVRLRPVLPPERAVAAVAATQPGRGGAVKSNAKHGDRTEELMAIQLEVKLSSKEFIAVVEQLGGTIQRERDAVDGTS